jgi:hypothetical protein
MLENSPHLSANCVDSDGSFKTMLVQSALAKQRMEILWETALRTLVEKRSEYGVGDCLDRVRSIV